MVDVASPAIGITCCIQAVPAQTVGQLYFKYIAAFFVLDVLLFPFVFFFDAVGFTILIFHHKLSLCDVFICCNTSFFVLTADQLQLLGGVVMQSCSDYF